MPRSEADRAPTCLGRTASVGQVNPPSPVSEWDALAIPSNAATRQTTLMQNKRMTSPLTEAPPQAICGCAPCNRVPAWSAKLADVVAPKPNTTAGKKRVYMSKDKGLQGGSREFPRIQAIRIVRVIGAP